MGANDSPHPKPRLSKREGDPKMIGLWKVGRTIGKGSSGVSPVAVAAREGSSMVSQVASGSHDIPRPASTQQ